MTTSLLIHPIPADHLLQVRATGRDTSGNPVVAVAGTGGEPLRCCLRNARPGERLILFGYAPPVPVASSPYRELGPVFTHAATCDAPSHEVGYPPEWLGRPQVLRAYDARGWIHPATTTHDGTDPEAALRSVLAADGVVEVHSRNIAYGCFMFAATISLR